MSNENILRENIVRAGKRLLYAHLNHGAAGNISVRLDQQTVLITPTGYDLAEMEAEDIVKINMEGNVLEGDLDPTSEVNIHLQILRNDPSIGAVIHTHAPYSTAFAVANFPMEKKLLPEFVNTVGSLPLIPFETPHTRDLADAVCEYMKRYKSVLIANHGMVTTGKTLKECLNNVEISEFTCQVSILCKIIGGELQIP
jgi:L-fuculose-phosphate aldolase